MQQVDACSFNLWIAPDCYKTKHETKYSAWFYFSVKALSTKVHGQTIFFTIKNMHIDMYKCFAEGMVPVYNSTTRNCSWNYIPKPLVKYSAFDNVLEVVFEYTFQKEDQNVEFALTFPYTTQRCEYFLDQLQRNLANDDEIFLKEEVVGVTPEAREIKRLTITNRVVQSEGLKHHRDSARYGGTQSTPEVMLALS